MEAGNVSAVVAIVQAVGEFFFFTPDKLKTKFWPDRLVAFDEFWVGAIPRLGDKNAKGLLFRIDCYLSVCLGWKNWKIVNTECDQAGEIAAEAEIVDQIEQQESELVTSLINSDGANRLCTWSELEQIRSRLYWRPLKPIAELLKSEPSEVILFKNCKSIFWF